MAAIGGLLNIKKHSCQTCDASLQPQTRFAFEPNHRHPFLDVKSKPHKGNEILSKQRRNNAPSASSTPSSPPGVPLSLPPVPAPELAAELRGEGGRRRPKTRRSTAAEATAAAAATLDAGVEAAAAEDEAAEEVEPPATAQPFYNAELCTFD